MRACEVYLRRADAVLDGEVDPGTHIEVEEHLARCPRCREHLAFAGSVKRAVRDAIEPGPSVEAPAALRSRLGAALDAEDRRRAELLSGMRAPRAGAWRYATPAAAAAAVALAVLAVRQTSEPEAPAPEARDPGVGEAERVLESVIRTAERPTEVVGPAPVLAGWFQGHLRFPVRPVEFAEPEIELVGGRLSTVRDAEAAAFYYKHRDAGRLTVVVFEPPRGLDRATRQAQVGGRGVNYGYVRGRTVPVRFHRGLSYAFTGDLDGERMLRLAAQARVSH
ncbi:MAG: anti-sigma factor family protein [Sandaracinaceae bacterium]